MADETPIDALARSGRLSWPQARALAGSPPVLDRQIEDALALGLPVARGVEGLAWQAGPEALRPDTIAAMLARSDHACPLTLSALIDSTSARLVSAAAQGERGPHLLFAECQSAGRGRRERRWLARYGEAIMFSLLADPGRPLRELPGLAIAVGVSLVRRMEGQGIAGVRLKWPNDLLLGDGKLGGILVETPGGRGATAVSVIGVGVNWRLSQRSRAQIGRPVADLSQAPSAQFPDRSVAAGHLACAVLDAVALFRRDGLTAFLDDFARFDALEGRRVSVATGTGTRSGIALGVAQDGSLKVRHDDGERRYHSAEVSVRTA